MWKSKCIFAAGADSREELAAVAVVCPTYMSEEGSVSSRGAEDWDFLEHIAIISLLSDSRAEVLQLNQQKPSTYQDLGSSEHFEESETFHLWSCNVSRSDPEESLTPYSH